MYQENERILYINNSWWIVDLTSYPTQWLSRCSILSFNEQNRSCKYAPKKQMKGFLHTQKQMSYILAPFCRSGPANPNCLNVSIVFGCSPSALPVDVLSGRSSRIVVLIPYRTRFDLVLPVNKMPQNWPFWPFCVKTHANIRPAGPAPITVTWLSFSPDSEAESTPFCIGSSRKPSLSIPGDIIASFSSRNSSCYKLCDSFLDLALPKSAFETYY